MSHPSGGPRVWAEFDDPSDGRRRFRCDLTWLTSRWTCIFGRGCPGIDKDRSDCGCCVLGVHLAGEEDVSRIQLTASRLTPETWQNHPGSNAPEAWSETLTEGDASVTKTRVVDGACIFANRDGFATGAGCALHFAGVAAGQSHLDVMPEACWQVPTRRTHRLVEHADDTSQVEVTVSEYSRRDWGPGWRDLDWYCTDSPEAHVGTEPVYVSNRDELVSLMGEAAYEELARHAEAHLSAVKSARAPGQRHLLPLLVHPATLAARPAAAPPPPPRKAAKAGRAKRRR